MTMTLASAKASFLRNYSRFCSEKPVSKDKYRKALIEGLFFHIYRRSSELRLALQSKTGSVKAGKAGKHGWRASFSMLITVLRSLK